MKKILSLLVAFVCLWSILLPGQEADAAAKINSWDLVDSSKHLD
ncbi:cell surface protein, partial [Listeria monocytogenes]|nr:cell surface protein [Listeria monocytogenes]